MVSLETLNTTAVRIALLFFMQVAPVAAQSYIDLDAGAVYSDVESSEVTFADGNLDGSDNGYHFAVGAYRNNAESKWVYGVKLELEDVAGKSLLSLRALDLGYMFTKRFGLNVFVGGSRWDLSTAAYGLRYGLGASYRFTDHWALAADIARGDKIARDKLLPGERPGSDNPQRGGIFYDITQTSLYLKYMF